MMTKAGVPILMCAAKASEVTGNNTVSGFFTGGLDIVKDGRPISNGFSRNLSPEFMETWQVGEVTGKMEDAADRLAKVHSDQAEFWFKQFSSWFPKVVYGLVSIFVIYQIFVMFKRAYGGLL